MNLFEAITGKISRMSHVTRYSSVAVIRRENVAEHSWWVAFISLLIGEDLHQHRGTWGHPTVDLERMLIRALVHDLSECVSGDIIRTFKYSDPALTAAINAADELSIRDLAEDLGSAGNTITDAWRNSKDESIEGDIVRFADMAVVAFYCREEDRTGNRGIRPVLEVMYNTWFHEFHDHRYLAPYLDAMFPTRSYTDMFREPDEAVVHVR